MTSAVLSSVDPAWCFKATRSARLSAAYLGRAHMWAFLVIRFPTRVLYGVSAKQGARRAGDCSATEAKSRGLVLEVNHEGRKRPLTSPPIIYSILYVSFGKSEKR